MAVTLNSSPVSATLPSECCSSGQLHVMDIVLDSNPWFSSQAAVLPNGYSSLYWVLTQDPRRLVQLCSPHGASHQPQISLPGSLPTSLCILAGCYLSLGNAAFWASCPGTSLQCHGFPIPWFGAGSSHVSPRAPRARPSPWLSSPD